MVSNLKVKLEENTKVKLEEAAKSAVRNALERAGEQMRRRAIGQWNELCRARALREREAREKLRGDD